MIPDILLTGLNSLKYYNLTISVDLIIQKTDFIFGCPSTYDCVNKMKRREKDHTHKRQQISMTQPAVTIT